MVWHPNTGCHPCVGSTPISDKCCGPVPSGGPKQKLNSPQPVTFVGLVCRRSYVGVLGFVISMITKFIFPTKIESDVPTSK